MHEGEWDFPTVISSIIENNIFYKRKKGKVFGLCHVLSKNFFSSLYDKQKNQQQAICKTNPVW